SLMYGYIVDGERRLPAAHQADGATPGNIVGQDFAIGPISIGTLPGNKSVTIQYQATIDNQSNQVIVNPVNQGTVSGTNLTNGASFPPNSVTTTLDTLTLGNLVFNDVNQNGVFDAGDVGINNVTLTLFADNGTTIGSLDAGDTQVATTNTQTVGGQAGSYSFANLAPGKYILRVDQANFATDGALANLRSSPAGAPAPNNNTDNDDNGAQTSPGLVITTLPITLSYNTEPTNDATGHGDINNTLDIGVFNAKPTETLTGSGTPSYTEQGAAAFPLAGSLH